MVKILDLKDFLKQFEDIDVGVEVPLIEYDSNWSLPDIYKVEEYYTKIKVKKRDVKIKRYRVIGRLIKNVEKPKTKKIYKGNLIRQGLKFIYRNREIWVILKSNWPKNLKNLPLNFKVKNNWLYFIVPKNFIGVWYKYGRGRINFTIVPEKIKLNKLFWETFGILIGEMSRGRVISIANTEPKLLKCILDFFEEVFSIKKAYWKVEMHINSKNIRNADKGQIAKKAKLYWKRQLRLKQINKIYWYDEFSTTLRNNFGEVQVAYFNKTIKVIINYLIKFVEKNVIKNKEDSINFLRGLIAAEGGTKGDKNDRLNCICIASSIEKERIFYKEICESIGLNAYLYEGNHNLQITELKSFLIALRFNLFGLNERRKRTFLKRLYRLTTIKAMFILSSSKKPLSIKNIVNLLNLRDYRNLNKNFSKLTKLGYLKRKSIDKRFFYSINKNSKRFYPFITAKGINLATKLPIPNP